MVGAALFAVVLLGVSAVRAEVTLQQCASAYEKGQEERLAGRYLAAKGEFQMCADPSCPASVVKDCENWHAQVDVVIPSVVPSAVDAKGNLIFGFVLSIDGASVEVPLGMKPVRLDVGAHVLRFEKSGYAPQEVTIELKEGEREVAVRATLTPLEPSPAVSPGGGEARQKRSLSSRQAAAIALGGVGVIVLGVSGYVGLRASSEFREFRDACSPDCTKAQADSVRRKILVSDVALGVGAVFVATAAVLYFVPFKSDRKMAFHVKSEAFGASTALSLKF